MKETKKSQNNNVHLYGYINDVRMNKTESGRTAINLDVVTLEQYKDKAGEFQTRRSYHDVAMFTEDKAVIEKFAAIEADCKNNVANKDVDGFKPKSHPVSLDGLLVNRDVAVDEQNFRTLLVLAREDAVKTDVKQEENETRNRADIVGNVAAIDVYKDKEFAAVKVVNHYHPQGEDAKDRETWVDLRIDGNRMYSKKAYEAAANGDLKPGDFIRVGGQLHNNRFEGKDGNMRYGVALDLTSFEKIERKEKVAEEQKAAPEKKAAPAKKAAAAKAEKPAKKAEPAKKATSRKKTGPAI